MIAEGRPMNTIRLAGQVDDNHRLSAEVPDSVPPGPVTVLIVPAGEEDDAGHAWMTGIAQEWADDLKDPRQDIYTLADGEPVRES
jgi:hypothetical protein